MDELEILESIGDLRSNPVEASRSVGSLRPGAGATARRDPSTLPTDGLDRAAALLNRSAILKTQSKRYRALKEKVKSIDPIPLADAIKQLKTFGTTKFIQTVEVSTNLGIDPRQSDQNVRGSVALPHGIGKAVRVAVFAQGENAEKATAAGADIVGGDDLAQRIKGGFMDFDVALATPDMMGVVGPLGRLLGPRGLMPSPRSGTVTTDISAGVREFKAGKIEFRSDKGGNVAAPVGKLSFSDEQLATTSTRSSTTSGSSSRRRPRGRTSGRSRSRRP